MKKTVFVLLLLIFCVFLFASCEGEEPEDNENRIVFGEKYGGNENFFVTAEQSLGELEMLHVQYNDGVLLFTTRNYLTGEVGVSTYDIYTGARTEQKRSMVASALGYKSGFVQGGGIYTFDGSSNSLVFYDESLNETRKTNLVNINIGEIYVLREYVFCISDGALFRVNINNNSAQRLYGFDGLNASSLRFVGADGNDLYVAGYDEAFADSLFVCDMKSGECKGAGKYDGKLLLRDGIAALDDYGGKTLSVKDFERPGLVSTLYLEREGEQLIGAGRGKVCTSFFEGDDLKMTQTLRVYSLQGTEPDCACTFAYDISLGETYIRDVFFVDEDFLLCETARGKTSSILLCKYSDFPAENPTRAPIVAGEEDETSEENREKIKLISEKYGVNILTGDDAVRYYPEYVVLPENGAKEISNALTRLEETLSKFPDGFFGELVQKGAYDSLNIVLCKKLIPARAGRPAGLSGFYVEYGEQYIVLSTGGDMENSLSHEVMHAVESAMRLYSHDAFGEWDSFNPEGFGYANSYVDENGREYDHDTLGEYTPYDPECIADPDKIAFFDYYSKTYEKEDRARIFEMLMRDELSPYFESKPIFAKAEYLCARLDDFFESVKNASDVCWKRILK